MPVLSGAPPAPDHAPGKRLGALSRRDSLALIAARPPSWRVKGILSTEDYGVLAGPKGVGKTFAMIDLAVAVALGEPWFGWFPTEPGVVEVLTSEDSRSRLWRRADAVARWMGHDPDGLEGKLFIHPFAFSASADLPRFTGELEAVQPGLVLLDPAYRYMTGVRAQLFDMGAVLTPLQEACSGAGAALLVGHHYNRREGAQREERISGAGLLEWARVVITVEAKPRRDDGPVIATFDITGNAIDPVTFAIDRRVRRLDDTPDPELSYEVAVLAEGERARQSRRMTAAERVLAVLPAVPEQGATTREIGDALKLDATGLGPLKQSTIRTALYRDLEGQVDSAAGRWWKA